jgi:hypothetical protein
MPAHRPTADRDHERTHVVIQGSCGQNPRRCRSCSPRKLLTDCWAGPFALRPRSGGRAPPRAGGPPTLSAQAGAVSEAAVGDAPSDTATPAMSCGHDQDAAVEPRHRAVLDPADLVGVVQEGRDQPAGRPVGARCPWSAGSSRADVEPAAADRHHRATPPEGKIGVAQRDHPPRARGHRAAFPTATASSAPTPSSAPRRTTA